LGGEVALSLSLSIQKVAFTPCSYTSLALTPGSKLKATDSSNYGVNDFGVSNEVSLLPGFECRLNKVAMRHLVSLECGIFHFGGALLYFLFAVEFLESCKRLFLTLVFIALWKWRQCLGDGTVP